MFSIFVTASSHASSYLRGRLLVHTEIGKSRPNRKSLHTCLLNCTYHNTKASPLAANTERVLYMSCELCEDQEVSHEIKAASHSPSHFMWLSIRLVGLGDIFLTSCLPPTSLYRSHDDSTNVFSMLNLYSFSQDKQQRIAVIRLMRCFPNRGSLAV